MRGGGREGEREERGSERGREGRSERGREGDDDMGYIVASVQAVFALHVCFPWETFVVHSKTLCVRMHVCIF